MNFDDLANSAGHLVSRGLRVFVRENRRARSPDMDREFIQNSPPTVQGFWGTTSPLSTAITADTTQPSGSTPRGGNLTSLRTPVPTPHSATRLSAITSTEANTGIECGHSGDVLARVSTPCIGQASVYDDGDFDSGYSCGGYGPMSPDPDDSVETMLRCL